MTATTSALTLTSTAEAVPAAARGAATTAAPAKPRGLWAAVWTGISAGLLLLIIGLALATVVIPRVSGATPLTVMTGSMRPHLPPGTLLIVKPEPASSIRVGDVVTYEPDANNSRTVISHRVIAITSESNGGRVFTVKGDANSAPDAPVQSKQIVAVLWYSVPLMGWVNAWMTGVGHVWFIPAAAIALFGYAAWNFIGALIQYRRRARQSHKHAG
ncbi:signal peptidase I [Gryllotalpicola reticulitermitis]|uniref:Signal peptidase I n=1 Tax=Gryllotalpicola reticulitermitis TaxID=1184153 RepID=A0ABV8Q6A2_9MICO